MPALWHLGYSESLGQDPNIQRLNGYGEFDDPRPSIKQLAEAILAKFEVGLNDKGANTPSQ